MKVQFASLKCGDAFCYDMNSSYRYFIKLKPNIQNGFAANLETGDVVSFGFDVIVESIELVVRSKQ